MGYSKVYKIEQLLSDPMFTHLVDSNDFEAHRHNHYEFVYIVNGSIQHVLNNQKTKLSAGDLVLISPGESHYFIRSISCVHRDILFSEEFFKRIFALTSSSESANSHIFATKAKLSTEEIMYFEKTLDDYNFNFLTNFESRNITAVAVLAQLLSAMLKTENRFNINSAPLWINEIISKFPDIEYLRGGLPLILINTQYNRIYIERVFKKYTGQTLKNFLTISRLNHAAIALRSTNRTIIDIIYDLGFSSPTYFYKLFKQYYNETPHAYRKSFMSPTS